MKHLIKDTELVAYLEGALSKEEVRQLKNKLTDICELSLLYHLQLSSDAGMKDYATELIDEDDFYIDSNSTHSINLNFGNEFRMAADKKFPEKE